MPPRPNTARAVAGPLKSLAVLLPLYAVVTYLTLTRHYALPTPISSPTASDGTAQLSEAAILGYAKYLSEDIGYRTVGTVEHAQADEWLWEKVQTFKKECDQVVRDTGRDVECEIWHQQGSGSHRFDMMGKRLYKTYSGLTNMIVRISNGTTASKDHALLINSHLDSTLPSPGAADDAMPVGVMLECMRVLLADPTWTPASAVVFLFNNAEESLQDGSHLFSTQHPIANTIRAVVNLEAAGTTGQELLFQATSEEMILAYSKVPYPFGTVVAADTFKTGVMLSDTDFRQFVQYLNVSGLDLAVVGNSYLYHMRKDLVENIEAGVAQHMAENTLSLIRTLSSPDSPLPNMKDGFTPPTSVYFSFMGAFVRYPASLGTWMYLGLTGLSIFGATRLPDPAPALVGNSFNRKFTMIGRGAIGSFASFLFAIVGANVVAALMVFLGKPLSWFSRAWLPIPLYAPPALAGALAARIVLPSPNEKAVISSTSVLLLSIATTLHVAGYGSGIVLVLSGAPLLLHMVPTDAARMPDWIYLVAGLGALTTGTQVSASVMDVFVPLTGRIGADVPADHVIASLVAILGSHTFPLVPAFASRYSKRSALRGLATLSILSVMLVGIYAAREPFDELHQKRLYVIHMHNTTTGSEHLHMAAADPSAGFAALVEELSGQFGVAGMSAEKAEVNDWNSEWDILYPFSAFLGPWKFTLPQQVEQGGSADAGSIEVKAVGNVVDSKAGTRTFTLEVTTHDVVWPVIAFDAHVLSWTLDDSPPAEYTRHHVKSASFLGSDTYNVGLVLNATSSSALTVSHVGVRRKAMWPARRHDQNRDPTLDFFERFEQFLDVKMQGRVDPTLIGCIGGVTVV